MNVLLTMSGFIFPLITFPYVSRILLPEGMGKVAMGTSVIAYFALLARLGIPMYGIRACAGVRDDKVQLSKTVHELFLINLFMSGISYILLFFNNSISSSVCRRKSFVFRYERNNYFRSAGGGMVI